jgi:DNA-binding winged helix-turn-helix (wHTH) protein/tetratricopeptide (TPR) repeat protein
MAAPQWLFDGFRLDPGNACLWRGAEPLVLPPKVFDVLQYLVTHPDRLVTKEELLDAVWAQTAVSEAVVRVAIGTLRRSLGDTRQPPRLIATVPRRGYRFLAPVTLGPPVPPAAHAPAAILPLSQRGLVERETIIERLWEAWRQARQGHRHVVWVTGEAGLGKTAVVEAFAAEVVRDPTVWVARGQCVEHYGTGEAYLPILEAVGALCRGPQQTTLVGLLRQQAPTWLVQWPWLLSASDRGLLQAELQGTTRERMLREGAEILEGLTGETPLLLLIEDLHWSDYATVDLLSLLARRRTPARLLVLGTYRPAEALGNQHPLHTVVQTLQQHGDATELALALLSLAGVAGYLAAHFPHHQFPAALAAWLHQRTDGHPLFLVTLVQALVERGVLQVQDGHWTIARDLETLAFEVPESLRQLLEQHLTRLPLACQQVLEVASVAGMEFVAAAVAAGLAVDPDVVEAHCEVLVRQQVLRPVGVTTWPNGTVATRYAFHHVLYQQGVYQRVSAGRRVRLHQRLGACLEAAYGTQAGEIAAELAEHFVRGQEPQRAVQYLHKAAENATQRYAHREVIALLHQALALLDQLPETPTRTQHELELLMTLGPALIATQGNTAPEVQHTYARARVLCQEVLESPYLAQILMGLMIFHTGQGAHQTAHEMGGHLLSLAQRRDDPVILLHAHSARGLSALYLGDLVASRGHLEQGIALCEHLTSQTQTLCALFDFGAVCRIGAAWALQQLGYADQARQREEEALALVREGASPFNRCNAFLHLAVVALFRREWQVAQQWVEEMLHLTVVPASLLYAALGMMLRGAVLTAQGQGYEALVSLRQSLATCHTLGAQLLHPWGLAMLGESYARLGQLAEGLTVLDEAQALMTTTHEVFYAAEIARLQGELRWQASWQRSDGGAPRWLAAAESCFQQALQVARRQQARWWELRAAMSLARLWQHQGQREKARALLAPVYGWFTEGFATADLQEAEALLEELGG